MTMMAEINPALFRLFERVDNAPAPTDEKLAALFERWLAARVEITMPPPASFAVQARTAGQQSFFLFETVVADRRDYRLRQGNDDVEAFLGDGRVGTSLKDAPNRRAAVRLRRLLDTVRASGEPLLARFEAAGPVSRRWLTEILVAPLSEDGRSTSGFLCGLTRRPVRTGVSTFGHGRQQSDILLFALDRDRSLATAIAHKLGIELSPLEEREFEDGEHKVRPLVDVRGRHVAVVAGLNGAARQSVNDRLCRLLFLIGCLKTNGAASVSAAAPYLCYLRKDRQTKTWDPLTGRYVAQLIEAAGADSLITMEAHNFAAFQNAFRIPTTHLDPYSVFAKALLPLVGDNELTVMSPDLGGSKRADLFREVLEKRLGRPVGAALMEKHRSLGVVSGDMFAGDVDGHTVIILDDMISSGATMACAAAACRQRGARAIYLAATHGLFSRAADTNLAGDHIKRILITNTVQPNRIPEGLRYRVETVDVSEVFANAIHSEQVS